jgi:hypothetical protein
MKMVHPSSPYTYIKFLTLKQVATIRIAVLLIGVNG